MALWQGKIGKQNNQTWMYQKFNITKVYMTLLLIVIELIFIF
jgi:hypothetical protein